MSAKRSIAETRIPRMLLLQQGFHGWEKHGGQSHSCRQSNHKPYNCGVKASRVFKGGKLRTRLMGNLRQSTNAPHFILLVKPITQWRKYWGSSPDLCWVKTTDQSEPYFLIRDAVGNRLPSYLKLPNSLRNVNQFARWVCNNHI